MHRENTNKALIYNSVVLYARLIVTTLCGLFTTRFALLALGIADFGLFSVLGSVISFIALANTIMLTTSNRFIAVAIGKKDENLANEQFCINLSLHLLIAISTLLIALPVGYFYINSFLNYEGDIINAHIVFVLSILGSVISFVGVPYNGLLMAKENFNVFSICDIILHILRLLFVYLLTICFTKKLLVYAIIVALTTAIPTLVYYVYCKKAYPGIVHFKLIKEKSKYKEIVSFSSWIGFGAVATVGKSQGAALIINLFFSTIMNTALGIANSICSYIQVFAQNVANPIAPQIIKSYTTGDMDRCTNLLVFSTKASFLLMLLISAPIVCCTDWVLNVWLHQVPPYATLFIKLMIIDILVQSLNSGISNIIFASGEIKLYQLLLNTLRLISIIVAFFVLKTGAPAYSLILVYIGFSILIFFAGQYVLNKTLKFNNKLLFIRSYIPSLAVAAVFIIYYFSSTALPELTRLLLSMVVVGVSAFIIGLSRAEKQYLMTLLNNKLKK